MTKSLCVDIDIAASPSQVWAVVSDLPRMNRWSPQCVAMKVLGGEVRRGARTINLNRRGPLFWPTTAKVVRFDVDEAIAFRITENHTIWSYTLEPTESGTRVTERREAPTGASAVSNFLVSKAFGSIERFDEELTAGMKSTLGKIKAAAEGARTVEA